MDKRYPLLDMNPMQAYEQYMVPGIMIPGVELMLQVAKPQSGERVLDIACGTGIVARTVAPLVGTHGTVTALDINPAMLAVARGLPQPEGASIDWREGSALALPLPDSEYDLVLCHQGFQFFPDKLAALRQARRVLVTGGRVVVSVQQSLQHNPVYLTFNEVLVGHMKLPALAAPFSFGEVEPLRAVLSEAGFNSVEVKSVSHVIRFASASIFIQASIIGSAAVIQEMARLDADAKTQLADQITQDMQSTLAPYVEADGTLVMPLNANIGSGIA
ncbi:MAG: class I SAM-dependent methyltransferase [Anaerolineae bacterium]|nr:class I SAM-dependent methyltransferase [Anaerolineae bacterium]